MPGEKNAEPSPAGSQGSSRRAQPILALSLPMAPQRSLRGTCWKSCLAVRSGCAPLDMLAPFLCPPPLQGTGIAGPP